MIRLLRLCFWGAALFAFVMAVLPQPPELPGEPSDKIQHALAFFTLAMLAACAYPRLHPLAIAALLCLFGGVIEIVQLIPALGRESDLIDWTVDTLAAGAGLLAVQIGRRALRQRRSMQAQRL